MDNPTARIDPDSVARKSEARDSATPLLLTRREEGIAFITLNRPGTLNLLTSEMIAALQVELERLSREKTLRVIVLAAITDGQTSG